MTNTAPCPTTTKLLSELTEKLGLPLPEMVGRGLIPAKVAAQMEQNCSACPNPAKCQSYLAAQSGKLDAPPHFCVNVRLLTFLSKTLPKAP